MHNRKRSYIIQSSLAMCVWAILVVIASIKFYSSDQLSLTTKLAIWGFFLINGICFIVILRRFYRKIDDLDHK